MNRSPLAGATPARNLLLQGSERETKPLAQVARKQPHATRTLLPVVRSRIPVCAPRRRNLRPVLQPRGHEPSAREPSALSSLEPSALGSLTAGTRNSQTPRPVLSRAPSAFLAGTWTSPTSLGKALKASNEAGDATRANASATVERAASQQLASLTNGNAALRFKKSPTPSTTEPFSLAGAPTLVSPEPCCGRGEDVATHVTWTPPS